MDIDRGMKIAWLIRGVEDFSVLPKAAKINSGTTSIRKCFTCIYFRSLYFYGSSKMKKTITRMIYAGIFLTAALVLGQKMFMENRVIDDDRVHTRPGSAGSVIAGGHGRNMSGVEDSVKIAGIDNFSVDGDSILFTSEDFVYENEDQFGESSYGNAVSNTGDGEKTTGGHNRNGDNSTPVGLGSSSAVNRPAGSRKADRSYTGGNGAGSNGAGGLGGGWGGNSAAGKDTDKDRADNTPPDVNRDQKNAAPAHKDKSDPSRGGIPGGDDSGDDKTTSGNPSDKQIPPEYFDAPPGELNDPFQPQIPAGEIGNQDHEGAGTSESSGPMAIPEPVSSLLIGLGGAMLLWSRRRSNRSGFSAM